MSTQVPTPLKDPDSAVGWWRLRNGSYGFIKGRTLVATWFGSIYQEDGKPFGQAVWDTRYNNLISKDYDLMNRYGGENERGWPAWLVKAAGSVEKKETSDSK